MFCCVNRPHFVMNSSVDGHLGCFRLWAVMTSAALDVLHKSWRGHVLISLGVIPRGGLAGHMVTLSSILWGTARHFFPKWLYHSIPTSSVWRFQVLHILTMLVVIWCVLVGSGISLWLLLAFLWWLMMSNIFSWACWPFVYLPWRNVYSDHLPISWLDYFCSYSVVSVLYIFQIQIPFR